LNNSSPLLTPNTFVLEVGDVEQGKVTGKFVLKNNSRKNIELVHIVKTCRCAEIEASAKEILPGKSTDLQVTWDTLGLRGRKRSDFVVFYRHSGEKESEKLDLSIWGNIVPEYDIEPKQITFQDNQYGQQVIKLVPKDISQRITIIGIKSDYPAFRFEKNSEMECLITFEPNNWFADPGRSFVHITLETDSYKEPFYVLPIIVTSTKQ
jgi:hypothetical protein